MRLVRYQLTQTFETRSLCRLCRLIGEVPTLARGDSWREQPKYPTEVCELLGDFSPAILFETHSIVICSDFTTHCFQTCLHLTYSVRRE